MRQDQQWAGVIISNGLLNVLEADVAKASVYFGRRQARQPETIDVVPAITGQRTAYSRSTLSLSRHCQASAFEVAFENKATITRQVRTDLTSQ